MVMEHALDVQHRDAEQSPLRCLPRPRAKLRANVNLTVIFPQHIKFFLEYRITELCRIDV